MKFLGFLAAFSILFCVCNGGSVREVQHSGKAVVHAEGSHYENAGTSGGNAQEGVNFHAKYLEYALGVVLRKTNVLAQKLGQVPDDIRHFKQRNDLRNKIMDLDRRRQWLEAKQNLAKTEPAVFVVLPEMFPYNSKPTKIPYSDDKPELQYIAYEIGRAQKEIQELEKQKKAVPAWNLVKKNDFDNKISDKDREVQNFNAELNAAAFGPN